MRAVRTVVGVVGELLITAGLVIMLYVVWTLYWVCLLYTSRCV